MKDQTQVVSQLEEFIATQAREAAHSIGLVQATIKSMRDRLFRLQDNDLPSIVDVSILVADMALFAAESSKARQYTETQLKLEELF